MSHEVVKFDLVSLLSSLGESLAEFENGFPLDDFAKGHYQQHPFVTLLTCCDSRVPPSMLGDTFNRVFCVENIGNQVKNSEGSVLYGLLHLQTPLMIVAGHTECGAIKAATSDFASEPSALVNELTTVKSSLDQACSGIKVDLATASPTQVQLSELNVDVQIDLLLNHAEIAPLVQRQSLQIIGVMVDLHNFYGEGYGKVYTVNVNGEKDVEAIKQMDKIGVFAAKAKRLPK
ncbi:MAG: carbonic anhydrase [Syntrophomonas sp.]|nr:carbonic anhydrase [Syntrophomonas sp.]